MVVAGLIASPISAQQAKPPAGTPSTKNSPVRSRVWKSETTGHEYRVRVTGESFYAERVNIDPALLKRGAYVRSECQRVGGKWVGTSRSYWPCETMESNKHVVNWCHFLTKIEIGSIQPDRITGRAEGFKRFDCQSCKVLETVWKDFVWVPKK